MVAIQQRRATRRRSRRGLLGPTGWLKLAILALAAAAATIPVPPELVESAYTEGFYAWLQPRLTRLTNQAPLAIIDLAGGAILLVATSGWILRLRRSGRGRSLRTVASLTADTAVLGAFLYLWFLAGWGLNYRREPLRESLDFQDHRVTQAALQLLASRTIDQLNHLWHDSARSGDLADVPESLRPGFVRARRQLDVPWEVSLAVPKRSLLNFYFKWTAVDGMTDPFFLETLVNQDLLPFERPFVVAHEWAHLAGYADESEANFVGWLTCLQGSAATRYSAWISLYGTVLSAVPASERPPLIARLEAGPRQDLRAMAERIARQSLPALRRAGNVVYDKFLRANRVEAGIASYSEVVTLILGTRFMADGTPVLRSAAP